MNTPAPSSRPPGMPLGIFGNNPGNLDFIAPPERPWNGQIGRDSETGRFGVYDTPANGMRALAKQLQKDYAASGATTLAQMITEWAPPSENDTAAYIEDVSKQTGIDPNQPFDLHANLPALATAITQHEQGQQPYSAADIETWVYLA
jgi:hypothetical protein